jgi:hypothetical protein
MDRNAIQPTWVKLNRSWMPIDDQGEVIFTVEPGVYRATNFRLLGKQGFVTLETTERTVPDVPTRYISVLEY